ncbi:CTLH domain-containing protein [Sporothrix brasiliensis 5110]|uniref:CTLH domain-containing protein n=1 Tax=Sporothrix brasiliensis 5110 TaxID=1398154 RepID=A0A0C2F0E0_9PEZI|nr:CTLH domain-containing protein [Sporothrix brasiliensis 5110]KIH92259.1 CTLH domain-containing protein [Sporothrix brasiliensis 5110]
MSFQSRVNAVKTPKSDINALILDYLTMEGYPQAAANFSKEANLPPQQDKSFVHARQQIRSAIHNGKIDEAITLLNHFNPELVERIRQANSSGNDFAPVVKFAQDQLAPRASTKKEFLEDLEETMVMLFFTPDKMPAAQQRLLSPDLREEVADKVNKAILFHHSKRREAAIRQIVRMRAWAENVAREKKLDVPDIIDLGLNATADNRFHDHEHEAMITT